MITPAAIHMRMNVGIVVPRIVGIVLLFFFLLRGKVVVVVVVVVLPGDEFTVPGELLHDLPDVQTEGFY